MVYTIIIIIIMTVKQCFICPRVNILKAHNITLYVRSSRACRYLTRINSGKKPQIMHVEKLYLKTNKQVSKPPILQSSCIMSVQP